MFDASSNIGNIVAFSLLLSSSSSFGGGGAFRSGAGRPLLSGEVEFSLGGPHGPLLLEKALEVDPGPLLDGHGDGI